MARLIVTDSEGEVTEHAMAAGPMTLGRSAKCNVVLMDAQASRIHAVIECDGRKIMLHDQQSHNGTWLNGERVEEAELADGDMVRIGETSLKLVVEEAPASGPARKADAKTGRKPPKKWTEKKGAADADPPGRKPAFEEPPTVVVPALAEDDAGKAATPAADAPAEEGPSRKRSPHESARSKVDRSAPGRRAKRSARASKKRGDPMTDREAAPAGRTFKSCGPAPAGDDPSETPASTTTTRRSRQVLGGMRLNKQQQNVVKMVSIAVSLICLVGIVLLLASRGDGGREGRRIVTDERAEPERLAEQARALAQQANAAENGNDTAEAYRLLCDAKGKMERANELMTALAQKYPGKGYTYLQTKAQMIATQAKGIRDQHFRIEQQLRRDGKLR